MALQRTSPQNVYLDRGNSLAIYIDGTTGTLMLKDSNGITQPVSDYISGAAGNYIQNQYDAPQDGNFWINGKGKFGPADFPESQSLNVYGYFNLRDLNYNILIGNTIPTLPETTIQNIGIGSSNYGILVTGENNIAIGQNSMQNVDNVNECIAIGTEALFSAINVNDTIAIGKGALQSSTIGINNIAIGVSSQINNLNGGNNVTIGKQTLTGNEEGDSNTIIGNNSLQRSADPNNNTIIGFSSCTATTAQINDTIAIGARNNPDDFSGCLFLSNFGVATYASQIIIGSTTNPLGKIAEETILSSHTLEILLNGELYRILMRKVIP